MGYKSQLTGYKGQLTGYSYLRDWVLSRPVDDVVQRPLTSHVIDADELQQTGVDETHAHAVPHVHGGQVGHDREGGPEPVRGGEKVQHGGDADHDARRHRVPLEPERDERRRHQNYPGNKNCREVEGPVTREDQVHTKAAVVTWGHNTRVSSSGTGLGFDY